MAQGHILGVLLPLTGEFCIHIFSFDEEMSVLQVGF
jgi:hypothetical protein